MKEEEKVQEQINASGPDYIKLQKRVRRKQIKEQINKVIRKEEITAIPKTKRQQLAIQAKEEEENRRKNALTPQSLGHKNERMKSEELLNEMELMDDENFDEDEDSDESNGRRQNAMENSNERKTDKQWNISPEKVSNKSQLNFMKKN